MNSNWSGWIAVNSSMTYKLIEYDKKMNIYTNSVLLLSKTKFESCVTFPHMKSSKQTRSQRFKFLRVCSSLVCLSRYVPSAVAWTKKKKRSGRKEQKEGEREKGNSTGLGATRSLFISHSCLNQGSLLVYAEAAAYIFE